MSEIKLKNPNREKSLDTSALREEIQQLYKSLQSKNEELITMEKAIVERNMLSIGKKNSQRQIGDNASTDDAIDTSVQSFSSNIECDRMAKQSAIAFERSDSSLETVHANNMETIREQNETIKELNEKVIRLSRHLSYVQRSLQTKDEQIVEYQNEIDKFRQIVRPITQKLFSRKKCSCADELNDCISGIGDWSPGIESTRVLPVGVPRMKRQAISAEPLSSMVRLSQEDGLIRIPKTSL